MNIAIAPIEPCGSCEFCKLASEVQKCLAFVDRKFMSVMQAAAREMSEAQWYGWDHGHKVAARRYRRLRAEWHVYRERILAPAVLRSMHCPKTLSTIIYVTPEAPAPREVTAIPSSMLEEAMHPDPRDGCYRCGARIDRAAGVHSIEVCAHCFGKETT